MTESTPGPGSSPQFPIPARDALQHETASWTGTSRLAPHRPVRRYFLASVLLLLTFVSTTTLGAILYLDSRTDESTDLLPFLCTTSLDCSRALEAVWSDTSLLRTGLTFSLPLLFILLCHELGHYLTCRYYGIASTLPYFLPSPWFIGTFGAFIRIRGRIPGKKELFDIGVAGPIAGFVALLPFLGLGILWSTPAAITLATTSQPAAALYVPGTSLAVAGLTWLIHGPLSSEMVLDLHPFALAAWVGLLATSLNLIPLGQLDGGHILYAVAGRRQRQLAVPLWLVLLVLGIVVWPGWLLWWVLLMIMGLRHPPISHPGAPVGSQEEKPLDRGRKKLAVLALLMLLLSFSPRPIHILLVEDAPPTPTVLAGHHSMSRQNVAGP